MSLFFRPPIKAPCYCCSEKSSLQFVHFINKDFVVALHMNTQLWSKKISKLNKKIFLRDTLIGTHSLQLLIVIRQKIGAAWFYPYILTALFLSLNKRWKHIFQTKFGDGFAKKKVAALLDFVQMRGGGYPYYVHFWSIKGVYFLQNANNLNVKLFFRLFIYRSIFYSINSTFISKLTFKS